LPQHTDGRSANQVFSPDEKLYRRIHPSEVNSMGEVIPARIQTVVAFKSTVEGAPSVNRALYSTPADVVHPDCCDGRDRSDCLVYAISVKDLPGVLHCQDGRDFTFIPHHHPLETCFAHSVIKSVDSADVAQGYGQLPKSLREPFRVQFASLLKPVPIA
jgi:hypothetical protein